MSLWIISCQGDHEKKTDTPSVQPHRTDSIGIAAIPEILIQAENAIQNGYPDSAKFLIGKLDFASKMRAQDSIHAFNLLMNLGGAYFESSQFQDADASFEKASQFVVRLATPPSTLIPLYYNLAKTKVELSDFTTALSMNRLAIKLIQEIRPDDLLQLGRCQGLWGNIFFYRREFEESIKKYNEAIALIKKSGGDTFETNNYHFNSSSAHLELKQFKLGLVSANKAAAIVTAREGENSRTMADIYLLKGQAHRGLAKNDSALYYLKRMAGIRRKLYPLKDAFNFGASWTIGSFFEGIGRADSSINYYQQSLISLVRDFNSMDWRINPRPTEVECNSDLILALEAKSRVLASLGKSDTESTLLLRAALQTYLLADSVLNIYRLKSSYDDTQQTLMDSYKIPYEEVMDINYELFRSTYDPVYLKTGLAIMESSRANLLQDALRRAEAYGQSGLPPALHQKEKELIRRRATLMARIEIQQQDPDDSIAQELLGVNREVQDLKQKIRAASPNYFKAKYERNLPDVDQIKNQLPEGTRYLEFLWGKHNVYVLAVSERNRELIQITRDAAFNQAMNQFHHELDSGKIYITDRGHFKAFCQSAFYLYNHLFSGALKEGADETILISADGPLASFPFDALITELPDTSEVDYQLNYLVRKFNISHVYSAGVMNLQGTHRKGGHRLLAFGYGGTGTEEVERSEFAGLPGTTIEIESIKAIMGEQSNRYFVDREASEHKFKSEVSNFNIAHLAIHGVADTINSLQSQLRFRSPGGASDDGQLYAHELYDIDLTQLDLAVLSACESGIGKNETGEGMMSMARGFAYAGCPSVVISLWKLGDNTAAQLMTSFYGELAKELPINQCLTNAKTAWLTQANEFNSHPSSWAALISIGDPRSLNMSSSIRKQFLLGAGLGVVLLLGWFIYRWRYSSRR